MTLTDHINEQLIKLDLLPLNSEQSACLIDPARIEEAAAMLDDLAARCSVRLPFPEGTVVGPFNSEEAAREEAKVRAQLYDAVSVDEMATDDSRSNGKDEYYVTGFSGPDAALAAACRPGVLSYWVAGEEHSAN